MATEIPLNSFVTETATLSTANVAMYVTPAGFTSIVLMGQITNVTSSATQVTAWLKSNTGVSTELAKNFDVPGYDATSVTVGKLVIPEAYTLVLVAAENDKLKATFSILETSNE